MKSGTKGMIIDTPKDSLVSVLARIVKHNICEDRKYSLGKKRKFVGSQGQGSDVCTARELLSVNSVGAELTVPGPS